MALQQFLNELFEASPNYSLACALGKLRAYGGISSLLNSLAIDHRQIADLYRHHQPRSLPSAPTLPSPERGKKTGRRQPQLESILLYLITLSFFVKVLLFDNGAQAELDVYSEVISFLFLIFIVAEKKSRAAGEAAERVPEESGEVRRVRVRRGGYEVACLSEEVVQGDIVLLEEGDFLRFDAILLDIVGEGEVAVNEEQVGTGRSKCRKTTVWKAEQGSLQDPFLLANSKVLSGRAWAVVCVGVRAGGKREAEVGGLLRLSSVSRQVEQVIRAAVVGLVAWLSVVWVRTESIGPYEIFLQLVYLVSCLTLYLSYASTSEFLACLKKFLKQRVNGRGYRILNHKLLEKLGEIDLFIVEDDCLSRDPELLTRVNRIVDLKIVTPLPQKRLQERFGGDLNHSLIFHPREGRLLRESLDQLARCKFLSIPYEQFRSYYLQVLKDLRYCMVYMSRSRAAIGKHQEIVTIKCSDMEGAAQGTEERLQGEWVRIAQGVGSEQVFLEMMGKARVYKRFQESFYAVLINNCLQLVMLIGWALAGCLVDLNLNLLVVFLNRNRVKQFYEGVAEERERAGVGRGRGWAGRGGLWVPVQVNLIFLIYYIYMNWEIAHSSNRQFQLFLLLMTNRMFRIEALLRESYHSALLYRLLAKSLVILTLILLEAFLKWHLGYNSDFISESLDTLLLPLILLLFTLFL